MISVLLALVARLPRPGRRRRPVVVTPPAAPVAAHPAAPHGRRCALLNPFGHRVFRLVASYQDAHPGVVHRGMVAVPAGQHRAPGRAVTVEFLGDDDTPTEVIRLSTDTAAWPLALPALLTPAGAR